MFLWRRVLLLSLVVLCSCAHRGGGKESVLQSPEPKNGFVAGDGLRITLPLDSGSFLNGVYPIDDQGNVFLPLVGSYKVVDLSEAQFTSFLKKTFEPYIHYPEVQVRPLIRVSLLGGFVNPGMYYVEPERSIWDLLSMAQGTVHERGLKKMVWERDRRVIRKDLIPHLESGESLRMVGFKTGDQIWTPTETRTAREIFVREVLPIATFALSLYIGIISLRN